jgi:hypothetical protein
MNHPLLRGERFKTCPSCRERIFLKDVKFAKVQVYWEIVPLSVRTFQPPRPNNREISTVWERRVGPAQQEVNERGRGEVSSGVSGIGRSVLWFCGRAVTHAANAFRHVVGR